MSKQKINKRLRGELTVKGYFFHDGGEYRGEKIPRGVVFLDHKNRAFHVGRGWDAAKKHFENRRTK